MTTAVLDQIDKALADWATSPDAMRWTPTPPPPPSPEPPYVPTPEQQARRDFEDAVYRWLVANDMREPAFRVPTDAAAHIERGRWIVCEVYQLTADGQIALDEAGNGVPPYVTVLVPLRVPPKDPRVWGWLGKPRGLPPPLAGRVKRRGCRRD